MSKRSGGGAIRIAVTATSAVRRAGLESIIRSHAEFHLAGSFGTMASLVSFARSTDLDVIVIDTDSIRALLIFESPVAFAARNGDENDPYLGGWRAYYKALVEADIYVGGMAVRLYWMLKTNQP